jgi:hypothetical protein
VHDPTTVKADCLTRKVYAHGIPKQSQNYLTLTASASSVSQRWDATAAGLIIYRWPVRSVDQLVVACIQAGVFRMVLRCVSAGSHAWKVQHTGVNWMAQSRRKTN